MLEKTFLKEILPNSVALLCPCGGDVSPRTLQSALSMVSFATMHGHVVRQVGITERTLIHSARNMLAEQFLESECEWSFWLDSDMVLEPRTISVMINWAKKLDAKFLTGVYYQRLGYHRPLVMIRDPKRKYNDEYEMNFARIPEGEKRAFPIDACGFGVALIHRDVYDKIEKPFFKTHFLPNGKEFSEDFYFCKQAREAGVKIYAIPELNCKHIGMSPLVDRKHFDAIDKKMTAQIQK